MIGIYGSLNKRGTMIIQRHAGQFYSPEIARVYLLVLFRMTAIPGALDLYYRRARIAVIHKKN